MLTGDRDSKPGTKEHFVRVARMQRWGTIRDYVLLCRGQGHFTAEFYAKAGAYMERIYVRRMLKQVRDPSGWPTFGSIERLDEHGQPERIFMQEELFGPEEYRQIVTYHHGVARHHLFKAQTYRDHAKARYGLQLPLLDEEDDEIEGI